MNAVAAMPPKGFEVKPKLDESGTPIGELLEISMGPHHPSTHGVFRMDVVLDGEKVVKLKPVFGYLHRNHEKIGENISYLASMPYTDRLDYFCSMTNNWAYALTVEKLAGLAVPERAEYIRVIMAELTRLQNHTCLIGFFVQDMGALGTPMMYAFREREKILDLFEEVSGARMMCNYMRFGGVRVDVNDDWIAQTKKVVADYSKFLDEFGTFLTENEILLARTQFIGVMSKELAINASITGPMLRAAGVNYDLRKVDKYGIYSRFNFQGAGRRTRRHLRPLHGARAGNAREHQDFGAGAARHSRRPGHGSEVQAARFPSKARRSLWPRRRAERRARILHHQRRLAESVSLPRAPAELYQFDGSGRHVPRPPDFRRRGHSRQRGHCARRGGPMKTILMEQPC